MLEQYDNTWVLFARDHLDLHLLGHKLSPDQFLVLNPVLVITLVPLVTLVWHALARLGWRARPTDKMFIGFLLTCVTPVILSVAGFRAVEVGEFRPCGWWRPM